MVALPVGTDVAEPFTDAEDIADVAAAALIEQGHADKIYKLTGPRLLMFPHAIGEIAREIGREIRYVSVSSEQFVSTLTVRRAPADHARLMAGLMGEVFDGRRRSTCRGLCAHPASRRCS